MQYELCRHVKTNGTRCKSPSLDGEKWCYFHNRLHQRHTTYRHTEATRGYLVPGQHIELAPLEDRESVQLALSCVINALATSPSASGIVRTIEPSPEGLDLAEPHFHEEPEYYLTWDPNDEDDDDEDEDQASEDQQP